MKRTRFTALAGLYQAHARVTADYRFACRAGCATCCSVNVVVTSLEAEYLRQAPAWQDPALEKDVRRAAAKPHYTPSCSTNLVAACCLAGREPPPDPSPHQHGACPLLDGQGRCRVYDHRPFACRSMVSAIPCRTGGEAVMEPFLVTLDLALCQVIEHLDRRGWTGNLLDMLTRSGAHGGDAPLVRNRPLPGFLVPPGEQPRFQAAMDTVLSWPLGHGQLGDLLPRSPRTDQGDR